MRYYNPADPSSSPFDPMIGAHVLFRPAKNSSLDSPIYPAVITEVKKDSVDDRVNLVVFTPIGILHYTNVPYSADETKSGVWFWMKEPVRRKVQCEEIQPA